MAFYNQKWGLETLKLEGVEDEKFWDNFRKDILVLRYKWYREEPVEQSFYDKVEKLVNSKLLRYKNSQMPLRERVDAVISNMAFSEEEKKNAVEENLTEETEKLLFTAEEKLERQDYLDTQLNAERLQRELIEESDKKEEMEDSISLISEESVVDDNLTFIEEVDNQIDLLREQEPQIVNRAKPHLFEEFQVKEEPETLTLSFQGEQEQARLFQVALNTPQEREGQNRTQFFNTIYRNTFANWWGEQQKSAMRKFAMDEFDLLYIDGESVRTVAQRKAQQMGRNLSGNEEKDFCRETLLREMASGSHSFEVVRLKREGNAAYRKEVSSVKLDMHAADAEERKTYSIFRRVLNFLGIWKIKTGADKQDEVWRKDTQESRNQRYQDVSSRMQEKVGEPENRIRLDLEGASNENSKTQQKAPALKKNGAQKQSPSKSNS